VPFRLLSGTGSQMAAIALAADIYGRTHSAVWLSATFFLTFGITGLLNPVAGLIADRFDRRGVMIASDVAGAIVWTVLLLGNSPPWLLTLGVSRHLPSATIAARSQGASRGPKRSSGGLPSLGDVRADGISEGCG
jgi:MFS transporter, DHA3 family, macrolide efflux protein